MTCPHPWVPSLSLHIEVYLDLVQGPLFWTTDFLQAWTLCCDPNLQSIRWHYKHSREEVNFYSDKAGSWLKLSQPEKYATNNSASKEKQSIYKHNRHMKFWEELMSLHSFKHLKSIQRSKLYMHVWAHITPPHSGFWHLMVSILSSDVIKIVWTWEIYPY